MPLRSFPIVYVTDVERSAAFWEILGFARYHRHPDEGPAGYIALRRDGREVAVVDGGWAPQRYGTDPGSGPRFEMFVYVDDVDAMTEALRRRGVQVLRDPTDMSWGERISSVLDPDGNPVTLANPGAGDGR